MLELLKRIEDQSTTDGTGLVDPSDNENEEDSLSRRFSAIDVSSASTDDLLRRLTKKEKDEFFAALRDPSSRLVQELLDSAELRKTRQLPWWEASDESDQSSQSLRLSHGTKPDPMAIPTNLIGQASRGISLLYNICAVFLAYSYVTRHLSMSPLASSTNDPQDQHEARRVLAQSVPFLTNHKSKVLHTSLTDAVTSFWSRLDSASINNKTMVLLLEDIAKLIRPQKVIVTSHSFGKRESAVTADHPSSTTVLVISDMSSLFSISIDSLAVGVRRNDVVMKLTFYAAHILSTPSSHLHALADEIHKLSMTLGKEVY
ncbi:hypothetical protein JVU11DRAFT_6236 [Chiua virens]|nr:hypothetical protein JVU11DRAFT_6236 [Chiua virens]